LIDAARRQRRLKLKPSERIRHLAADIPRRGGNITRALLSRIDHHELMQNIAILGDKLLLLLLKFQPHSQMLLQRANQVP
jgi:hypothetical protein